MKKIFSVLLAVFMLVGCTSADTDATKFKKEYEALNGKENANGRDYVNVTIPSENPMVYADIDKIMEVINGTGIVTFT